MGEEVDVAVAELEEVEVAVAELEEVDVAVAELEEVAVGVGARHAEEVVLPGPDVRNPAGQAVHDVDPGADEYVFGGHKEHDDAPAALHEPAGQLEQLDA